MRDGQDVRRAVATSFIPDHTHVASWRAALGASSSHRRAAGVLVPWLKEIKRALVALGATYFCSDDTQFRYQAANLERAATAAADTVREYMREDGSDDLLQRLAGEFTALEVLAHELGRAPAGAVHIAQLRACYLRLRDLGSALWEFEYQFEGNPRAKEDIGV